MASEAKMASKSEKQNLPRFSLKSTLIVYKCTLTVQIKKLSVSSPILCMLSCITHEIKNNDVKITVVFVQHGRLLKR